MSTLSQKQYELAAEFLKGFNPHITATRDGHAALVLSENGSGDWPLLGVYHNGLEWIPAKWMTDGRYPSINENVLKTGLDLDLTKEGPVVDLA